MSQKIRKRCFIISLCALILISAGGYLVQWLMSYDITAEDRLRHGTFGLYLSSFPKHDPAKKRVILLGNSAWFFSKTCTHFRKIAEEKKLPLEFANLSQVGSGVSDLAVQCAYSLDKKPDALVICLSEITFLQIGFRFRTDCDTIAFAPAVVSRLPASFYLREFGYKSAAQSICCQITPFKRLDPILIYNFSWQIPASVRSKFEFPTLNLVEDQITGMRRRHITGDRSTENSLHQDYGKTFAEIAEMLAGVGVPVLFLWQECGNVTLRKEIMQIMTPSLEKYDNLKMVDLEGNYDVEKFSDHIHPRKEFFGWYAKNHFSRIEQFLVEEKVLVAGGDAE